MLVPVSWFDTQNGPPGAWTNPHGFFNNGSVTAADIAATAGLAYEGLDDAEYSDRLIAEGNPGWLIEAFASMFTSVREGRFDYVDVVDEHLEGNRRIASEGVVIAGKWWHPR